MVAIFFKEYVLKEEDEKPEDENISNILLWAIFANRKELAEICWLRVENHLCKFHNIFKWKTAQCADSDNQYLPHFNYFYYCIANIKALSTNYNVKQFIGLFYNCFCHIETQNSNVKTNVFVKQILTYCSDISKKGNFLWHCFFFLVTGLVCSAILKKLSTKANNVKEQILSNDLEEHSK